MLRQGAHQRAASVGFCQDSRQQMQPTLSASGQGRSSGFQDGERGRGPAEEEHSAAVCGNVLVVTRAETEEVAELIMTAAEPVGRSWALEALHGPVSAFEAPV